MVFDRYVRLISGTVKASPWFAEPLDFCDGMLLTGLAAWLGNPWANGSHELDADYARTSVADIR